MAVTTQIMTDEQRKSVALEYLKAFDHGGVTSTGGSILDLFADDAQVYFPKWGIAEGKAEQINADVSERIAHAINQLRARIAEEEATAGDANVTQCCPNLRVCVNRHLRIRVEKPEHLSARDLGPGIHLRGPAAASHDQPIR